MEGLMEKAAETVDFSLPSIVVFPETIGLWLSFIPETYDQVRSRNTENDPIIEDTAPSFSASCGVPTRDCNVAAYDKETEPVEVPAQLIEVDNFKAMIKAKQAQRKTEKESDKIPVAGD